MTYSGLQPAWFVHLGLCVSMAHGSEAGDVGAEVLSLRTDYLGIQNLRLALAG